MTAERELYIFAFYCVKKLSELSAALLTLPLHHYQHTPFLPFRPCGVLVVFFIYISNLKSFVCEGHETAGMVSVRAVYEIAQVKAQDECFKMRNSSMETVVKCIIGSARSLGIKVVNE